jgi:signal transduction histidine kinase
VSSTAIVPIKSLQISRVLVIDDDPDIFALCQRALRHAGFVVLSINAHDQVLDMLQNDLFDLVMVSLRNATPCGLALIEQIRVQTIDMPIVVLSERPSERNSPVLESIAQAVRLGIQGVLFKPLCPAELHTTIVEVLQKHRRDSSKRWNMIQQMIQTEKLAAAGRLVTSIAHEMNNPLQALHNSLNLVSKSNRSFNNKKRQQYLGMAQQEVERLITIVRNMLDLYRPSVEGMHPTNLNNLLEGVLRLVDDQLHTSKVSVLRDWCPKLPNVFAIASRLKQACHHLITNAIEAMPNGGVLTIRTYTLTGSEYQINAGFEFTPTGVAGHLLKGPSVVIEITDTGRGIAPDELPRIFEPFYSSRFESTGLGLAISYSIVEQHRGELSVSSSEGKGTTIRVRLPAA